MPPQDTSRKFSPARLRLFRALTVAASLTLCFVAAEFGLRLVAYQTNYMPKPLLMLLADHYYLRKALVPGATYESRRAHIRANSLGFRGKEFTPEKPSGAYRIFAQGGSTTFGFFPSILSDDDSYPARLEAMLNQVKPDPSVSRYEVINAGVPGYSLRTSIHNFASRIVHLHPDMIVICHNNNDLARYGSEDELRKPMLNYFANADWADVIFDRLFGWSYAFQELRFTLTQRINLSAFFRRHSEVQSGEWRRDERYPEAYHRDLRNLVLLAKGNKVVPVLATESIAITEKTDFSHLTPDEVGMQLNKPFPIAASIPPRQRHAMFKLYNDIIRKSAAEEGVPLADIDAAVPKTPEYHWDHCHLTGKGEALAARVVYEALMRMRR